MARFHPLYIRRSDGVLETVAKNKKREKNEPTPEQLDSTPDSKGVCDYYRPLSRDDAKHLDWRRKLAGMLIREIGTKEHLTPDKAYILYDLPENYRLFEHIKSKAVQTRPDGTEEPPKSKTHSGAGHDRQDAYLYGHPQGRKKRFRSPADFFPHLLWLATDPEGDINNCTCKTCAPEELQVDEPKEPKPLPARKDETEERPTGQPTPNLPIVNPPVVSDVPRQSTPQNPHTPTPRPPSVASAVSTAARSQMPSSQAPNSQVGSQASSQLGPPPGSQLGTQSGALIAVQAVSGINPQAASQAGYPTPVQQPTSMDQQVDLEYNSFIYRPGELVWFNRGTAWGLGVMIRRFTWATDPQRPMRAYVVQPLSHPFHNIPQLTLNSDDLMRPWLKWSAPLLMSPGLRQIPNLTYEATDWRAVLNGAFGRADDAEVDASILAARAIDMTYTLIKLIKTSNPEPSIRERRFSGIFLGGEKIWVGDPVRLKFGAAGDVLVLGEIIERTQTAIGVQQPQVSVILVGDVFQLLPVKNPQQDVSPIVGIPQRMMKDVDVRNSVSRVKLFWQHTTSRCMCGIQGVKGRWYEASVLGPRLEPESWQAAVASGNIVEANNGWNGRGDAQHEEAHKTLLIPKNDRVEAMGKAVPQGTVIFEGTNAPPAQELARMLDTSQSGSQEQIDPEPVAIADFMDLEKMENDGMHSYQNDFGGHFGSGNYFG